MSKVIQGTVLVCDKLATTILIECIEYTYYVLRFQGEMGVIDQLYSIVLQKQQYSLSFLTVTSPHSNAKSQPR